MCLEYAQRIYSQYDAVVGVGAVHTDPSSQMEITLSWTQQSTANTIEAVSINISFDLMYHPGNSAVSLHWWQLLGSLGRGREVKIIRSEHHICHGPYTCLLFMRCLFLLLVQGLFGPCLPTDGGFGSACFKYKYLIGEMRTNLNVDIFTYWSSSK